MPRAKLTLESIQPDQFIATAHVECLTEVQLGHLAAKLAGDERHTRSRAAGGRGL